MPSTNQPTAGAMRAAEAIIDLDRDNMTTEELAAIIDRENEFVTREEFDVLADRFNALNRRFGRMLKIYAADQKLLHEIASVEGGGESA